MTTTATDYAKVRETMVEQQVRPWDVLDTRVLEVLNLVPRDAFAPDAYRAVAYADLQIPIGHGEVMLKPVIEGRMLQGGAPRATPPQGGWGTPRRGSPPTRGAPARAPGEPPT
jgi:hypothetical protein